MVYARCSQCIQARTFSSCPIRMKCTSIRFYRYAHPFDDLTYIQQSKGLADPPLFTEIVTNPAHWEPNGLLRLTRRIPPDGPQHSCRVGCSANMCKGRLAKDVSNHGTVTYTMYQQVTSLMHSNNGMQIASMSGLSM